MRTLILLFRGINVGGKNRVPMAELRALLEELGFTEPRTLIASGNAVVRSSYSVAETRRRVEQALPARFSLDTDLLKVLVLTPAKLQAIVDDRPEGFGDDPDTYHSDAIFLIDITAARAMKVFRPRDGVDAIWPGAGVIYSQRRSAELSRSRLGTIVGTDAYRSMTIRSWQTTRKLLELATA